MCSKCYPNITDFMDCDVAKEVPQDVEWRIFKKISENLYIVSNGKRLSLLIVFTINVNTPTKIVDAELFFKKYPSPDDAPSVADKLRWYRHKQGLLQREVADFIGVDRTTYFRYETTGLNNHYPKDKLLALAELYQVEVSNFLDDYNLFLYNGQATEVKKKREQLGMSKRAFARYLGVSKTAVINWENESVRISKKLWERFFR